MAHKFSNAIRPIRGRGANFPAGICIAGTTTPCGYVSITGKEGDVVYVRASEYLSSKFDQGSWCQAVTSPVKIYFTLQNEALASNPDEETQKQVSWCNEMTVEPGKITLLDPPAATCIKIEFQGPGSFYILAR